MYIVVYSHFCLGSSSPTACMPGYYNPNPGGTTNSSCLSCPAGYSCPVSALTTGITYIN